MRIKLSIVLTLVAFISVANCKKKEEPVQEPEKVVSTGTEMDADTKAGKEIFDVQCASCHGEKGAGDGVASAALNPKPRNYTAPASEWKNGKTIEGITKTLNEGIKGGAMVAYKHLGDDNIKKVAKYVLYLGK
ncbi:MAG: cytochrome c [Leptospiraceae bacterium]|nr:cytochrome c [Leptospiraceae bacterium]